MSSLETAERCNDIISWDNITFTVDSPTQGHLQILQNISGYAVGGRLLAILGASGSGKTTLLDILCNRKRNGVHGRIHGNILINGEKRGSRGGVDNSATSKQRHHFSYVPQHDLLLNTATVRETLETAARLRVPNLAPEELHNRVNTVLADLGLTHREHALVGGGEIRGLSGGERRRVSIGQEIVSTQSAVLCLDEPTTGLDSSTAESVMSCLRELTRRKGTLVIATIHQPNSNITSMFDDFMLMATGRCIYLGPYGSAVERFAKSGFICPLYCNPTDYFISVATDASHISLLADAQVAWLDDQLDQDSTEASRAFKRTDISPTSPSKPGINKTLSGSGLRLMSSLSSLSSHDKDNSSSSSSNDAHFDYPTSTTNQVYLLTLRAARQWIRNPEMLISELIQYIFIALFIGGMYFQVDNSLVGGVYNRTSALFFLLSVMIFTPPFTAITAFAHERALLAKEREDRMYSTFSWLCAKTIVVFPIEAALCLVFSAICYWMIGFQPTADKFFIFFVIMATFQLAAESLGLLFAIGTASPTFAIVWLSLVLIVALSLTGFLTYSMPVYYSWIMQSNLMRFALMGLIVNEFQGISFHSPDGVTVAGLDALPTSLRPDLSLGDYIVIMIAFLVGLRIAVYMALWGQDKSWSKMFGIFGNSGTSQEGLDTPNSGQTAGRDANATRIDVDASKSLMPSKEQPDV